MQLYDDKNYIKYYNAANGGVNTAYAFYAVDGAGSPAAKRRLTFL